MAERIVSWKALADFAKVRTEAAKTQASLAALQAQVDKNNAKSAAGAAEAAAVNKNQEKSETSLASALRDTARARDESSKTATKLADETRQSANASGQEVVAIERAATAHQNLGKELDKVAQARLRVARAEQQLNSAQTKETLAAGAVTAAYARLNQAHDAASKAAGEVERAENKLNSALDKHGASSGQAQAASNRLASAHEAAARAASDVEKFTLRASQAENRLQLAHLTSVGAANRLVSAEQNLVRVQSSAGGGGNNLIGVLGRLEGAFGGAGGAAGALSGAFNLIKWPAVAAGIYTVLGAISALISGLFALGSAIGPAIGALAAIGPLAAGIGGAFATIKLGTGGAIKALQAYTKQQNAVGGASKKSADQQISNAEAIKNAQQQLADARENVGVVEQQVADSISSASKQVKDAQATEIQSVKDLSQARKDAKKNIDDLKQAVVDAALAEKAATYGLEDAKLNLQHVLNDPNSTRLQRQEAQLQVDQAKQQVVEAKKNSAETKKASDDASKKGVEGADNVVQAKKAELDAQQAVVDAQHQYNEAVQSGARQNRKAQEEVAKAVQNLADAQRKATEATDAGGAAASQYQNQLSKLTPAGKAFVAELLRWKDLIDKLKATAQDNLLPGLTTALRNSEKLFPVLNEAVAKFGRTLGNTAVQASKMFTSLTWIRSLRSLFSAGANIVGILGHAFLMLLDVLRAVSVAAIPLATNMAKATDAAASHLDKIATAPGAYQRMVTWFGKSYDVLHKLGLILKQVSIALFETGKAASGAGTSMLDSIVAITKKWEDWTKSVEGQNKMKAFFDQVRSNLTIIDGAIGKVAIAFLKLGGSNNFTAILNFFKSLVPEVKQLLQNLSKAGITKQLEDIVRNLLDVFTQLSSAGGGALKAFVTVIDDFTKALDWFVKQPGAAELIKGIALAFGAYAGIKLVGTITGIGKLAGALKNFIKLRQDAAKAQAAGDALSLGQKVALNAGDAVKAVPSKVLDSFKKLQDFVSGSKIKSGLKSMGSSFLTIGKQAGSAVKSIAKLVAANIAAGFAALGKAIVSLGKAFLVFGRFLLANPIILIIAAIITIVILMVTHWKETQKILSAIWNAILGVAKAVWGAIAKFFTQLWGQIEGAAKAVWKAIGDAIEAVWKGIQKAIQLIWLAIKLWITTEWNIYKTIVTTVWNAIKVIIENVWKAIQKAIQFVWNAIKLFFTVQWNAFKTVVTTVWNSVKTIITTAFSGVWNGLKSAWKSISGWFGRIFSDLKTSVKTAWDTIASTITSAFGAVSKGLSKVWDGVKKSFTDAINFVTQDIINPFIRAIDAVVGIFGLKIPTIPKLGGSGGGAPAKLSGTASGNTTHGFAGGGVLPGYTPGKDVHTFHSASAGTLKLSGGEGILVPEAVRALGGATGINSINSEFSRGRVRRKGPGEFAGGGILPGMGRTASFKTGGAGPGGITKGDLFRNAGISIPGTSVLRSIGAWLSDKALKVAEAPLRALINKAGHPIKDIGNATFNTINKLVVDFIRGHAKKAAAIKGGPGGGPINVGDHAALIAQALGLAGVPATAGNISDVNLIVSNESGWNPKAINLSDSNAAAGHPSQGLMQTIPGTFEANRLPSLPDDITNPLANLVAGIRYAVSRYGSLDNVPGVASVHSGGGYVGYKAGGVIQNFHKGGMFAGIGPSHGGPAIAALKLQSLVEAPGNLLWTSGLTNVVKRRLSGVNDHTDVTNTGFAPRSFANLNANDPRIKNFAHWLAVKKPKTYQQMAKVAGSNPYFPMQAVMSNSKLFSQYKWPHGYNPLSIINREKNNYIGWVDSYRSIMKVNGNRGRPWTKEMDAPSDHIMAHALNIPHPADWPHPWSGSVSSLEEDIATTERGNALNTEFYNDLQILANWGFSDLVDDLLDKGTADGLQIARDAIKNKSEASRLNDAIKAGKNGFGGLSQDDKNTVLQVTAQIAGGTAAKPVGLRAVAGKLQVPEYSVVNLYDKMAAQLKALPAAITAKFNSDVALFRQGLFYANTGAVVPGTGHTDSVPAMLTPGEGVLKKKAMEWLGVDNFHALNNGEMPQMFANGGIVLAPNVGLPRIPDSAVGTPTLPRGAVGKQGDTIINNEYNTEINNPTGENSVYSMNKMLQRKAALGPHGDDGKRK